MQEKRARDNGRDSLARRAVARERTQVVAANVLRVRCRESQARLSLFGELCSQNVFSRDECFIQEINFPHANDAELD